MKIINIMHVNAVYLLSEGAGGGGGARCEFSVEDGEKIHIKDIIDSTNLHYSLTVFLR
jgi:hypothetical protein